MRTYAASFAVSLDPAVARYLSGLSAPECCLLTVLAFALLVVTLPLWIFLAGLACLAGTALAIVLWIVQQIEGDRCDTSPVRKPRPVSIPLPPRPVRQTPPPVPQPKRIPTAAVANNGRIERAPARARRLVIATSRLARASGYRPTVALARQAGGYRPVTRLTSESATPVISICDGQHSSPPYVPQTEERVTPKFEEPLRLNDRRREELIRYFEAQRNGEKPSLYVSVGNGPTVPAQNVPIRPVHPLPMREPVQVVRYSPPALLTDVQPVSLSALVSVDPGEILSVLASAYADGPVAFDEESATPLPVVYPIETETVEPTATKRPRRQGKRPAGRVLTVENLSALLDGPRETVTADAPADALGTVPAGWESTGPSDCFDLPTEAELDTDAIRFATEVEPTDKVGSTAKILPVREEKGPADEGYVPASDGLDQIARAGLRAICRAERIAFAGKDTPAVLREKIRAARAR